MRKLMLSFMGLVLFIACNNEKPAENKEAVSATGTEAKPQMDAEFADAKYMDIGKKGLADLSAGNVDEWMNSFAENAMYRWNNGDSLAGKAAISDYWKKRRTTVIDSISFSNDIWLPVKVNKPQQPSVQAPGTWLLAWYKTTAKYKTGKSMTQWIHTDMHFDATDKIDIVIQYLDRVPIAEAMKK